MCIPLLRLLLLLRLLSGLHVLLRQLLRQRQLQPWKVHVNAVPCLLNNCLHVTGWNQLLPLLLQQRLLLLLTCIHTRLLQLTQRRHLQLPLLRWLLLLLNWWLLRLRQHYAVCWHRAGTCMLVLLLSRLCTNRTLHWWLLLLLRWLQPL